MLTGSVAEVSMVVLLSGVIISCESDPVILIHWNSNG